MGVARAVSALLDVNQKTGFDCPGCAWPDPENHRSIAEFCENGAKAIAEEGTLKRVTAEFLLLVPSMNFRGSPTIGSASKAD